MSSDAFEVLHVERDTLKTFKVGKVLVALIALIVVLFFTSMMLCVTNDECRNKIPTLSNMLNSTFTTPFVVSGMNAGLGLHMITTWCLYSMTSVHVYLWSMLQVFLAIAVYFSVIVTMFVFPFTGWEANWANLAVIFSLVLWMVSVMLCLYRFYGRKLQGHRGLLRWNVVFFALFAMCTIVYIALRSVGSLGIVPKDDGLLVVEIVGGLSFFAFMVLMLVHIGRMTVHLEQPRATE